MDNSKIEAMFNYPIIRTIKELGGFLRLTEHYRKFVMDYGIISKPFTELLKKDSIG